MAAASVFPVLLAEALRHPLRRKSDLRAQASHQARRQRRLALYQPKPISSSGRLLLRATRRRSRRAAAGEPVPDIAGLIRLVGDSGGAGRPGRKGKRTSSARGICRLMEHHRAGLRSAARCWRSSGIHTPGAGTRRHQAVRSPSLDDQPRRAVRSSPMARLSSRLVE